LVVLLARKGGGAAVPLYCQTCGQVIRKCVAKALVFHETDVGKMVIRTLQAIFHRDEHILEEFYTKRVIPKCTATDADGSLHLHVLMGRMCKFEPYVGQTADVARRVAEAKGGTLGSRLAAALPWYSLTTKHAITPVVPTGVTAWNSARISQTLFCNLGGILRCRRYTRFSRGAHNSMTFTSR